MAAAPADDYDYSKDAIVLVEEPDSDTEPTDTDRKINPHNLENAAELKAGGFGVSVRSTEELKTSGIFSMEEDAGGVRWMATKPWKGAIVAPSAAPRNVTTEPSAGLTLEWMHGYHGYDARSNLVYNAVGHIVYPIAGVVVVYDQKEHKQRHFMGHNDEVTCLAQSPVNPNIIATGQVATIVNRRATAPHICVWDSSSKPFTQIKIPNAGQRSIRCLGFSHDGKLLASVGNDDKQTVTLWDWQSKTKLAYLEGDASKVYAIRWNTKVPGEFVTAGEKHLYFYSWNGAELKRTKARMGGKYAWQSFFSLAFTDKGNTCVGGFDGSISVFMGGECKKCVKVSASKVNSLEFFPGGIIAGSSDCKIALCDKALQSVRQISLPGKVSAVHIRGDDILAGTMTAEIFELPGALSAAGFRTAPASEAKLAPVVSGHFDGELWGAATAPDGKTFMSCGEDNRVHKWDLARHRLIGSAIIEAKRAAMPKVLRASTASTHPPNQCARAIAINPAQTEFAIGSNDGVVHVYDFATLVKKHSLDLNQHGKRVVTGQKGNWIQVLKYSPSGATLAVGTHGSVICLLDPARGYATRAVLDKHNSFITHLDWSLDGHAMQSNDGAYELLFWSIDEKEPRNSRQNTSATGTKDVVWASQTCILGWSVQGIFDPSQDGTDVNTVDTSPSRTLIVTGDDYGDLNLFRFPCAAEGNAKKSYIGHSSHVVTTRFTSDERYVVSAGGADKALGVWRVTA